MSEEEEEDEEVRRIKRGKRWCDWSNTFYNDSSIFFGEFLYFLVRSKSTKAICHLFCVFVL